MALRDDCSNQFTFGCPFSVKVGCLCLYYCLDKAEVKMKPLLIGIFVEIKAF